MKLLSLPSYSPDLSSTEEAFSNLHACTREALVEAIARALATVISEDATGWFDYADCKARRAEELGEGRFKLPHAQHDRLELLRGSAG